MDFTAGIKESDAVPLAEVSRGAAVNVSIVIDEKVIDLISVTRVIDPVKQVVGIDGKSGFTKKIPYPCYLFFRLVLDIVIAVLPDALEIKTDKFLFLIRDVFERIKNSFHAVDVGAGIIYAGYYGNAGLQQQFYVLDYRVETSFAIFLND